MHYVEFLSFVEKIVCDVVRRCYPTSWDEDHITYSIADNLASQLTSVQVHGLDRPFKTTWDVRKLRGSPERTFGDLAVVVCLRSWSGEDLDGVGFLEAKRRDTKKATFRAIRKGQLKTILRNAPLSRLLLYDFGQITDFGDNVASSEIWPAQLVPPWFAGYPRSFPAVTQFTHGLAVPTGIALSTGINSTGLYKYGIPFSIQLCGRYLRGFDLEYRDTAVSKVEKFVNQNGGPRYLLLVGVSTGEAEPVLPAWVDENLYGAVGE